MQLVYKIYNTKLDYQSQNYYVKVYVIKSHVVQILHSSNLYYR